MLIAGLGACLALGVGCGIGARDEPLTASEYRKQANALCVKEYEELQQIPKPQSSDGFDGFIHYLEQAYEPGRQYTEGAEALQPPPALKPLHERGLRLAREGDEASASLIKRMKTSDDPSATYAAAEGEFSRLRRQRDTVISQLELNGCVRIQAKADAEARADGGADGDSRGNPDSAGCRDIEATGRELRGDASSAASEVRAERRTVEGLEDEVRTYPENRAKIEPDLSSSRRTLKENQRELGKARRELKSLEADARRAGCAVPRGPPPVNAAACREIDQERRELRGEVRSAAEEVRAEQTTIDELEREIREYPEDRAETEPDLKSSKRAMKDIRGELAAARRGLRSAHADARRERCTR